MIPRLYMLDVWNASLAMPDAELQIDVADGSFPVLGARGTVSGGYGWRMGVSGYNYMYACRT